YSNARAEEAEILPLPRYVTLASDEVNVRVGPGLRYPVRFILSREGLPVEIVREFDVWRQIRTREGDEGWVHKSLLSGRRAVIVTAEETLTRKAAADARPVARLEQGVVATLDRCDMQWCRL